MSIWTTADLWVLLAFSDMKSKLCERWWRCSNRNGEWKWANRRSCSIKTQNDNQNKWDYQRTSRRKSTRNICSGEAEIKRIIRLWSCVHLEKSLWRVWGCEEEYLVLCPCGGIIYYLLFFRSHWVLRLRMLYLPRNTDLQQKRWNVHCRFRKF